VSLDYGGVVFTEAEVFGFVKNNVYRYKCNILLIFNLRLWYAAP
jgi:hypothetical protein